MEPWLPPSSVLQTITAGLARRAMAISDRLGRRLRIMEVCGTHTAAITRTGLRHLFAPAIEFRSGPGCPVCVTGDADLAMVLFVARTPGVIIASPGDLIRVPLPGSDSLETEVAHGKADVRVVLSPIHALELANGHPSREVVLLALGFETTMPVTAATVLRADRGYTRNFSVLTLHKVMPPALRAVLLRRDGIEMDGLLLPGHVSVITGRKAFAFVASEAKTPAAIAGFEPGDVLLGIESLLRQIESGSPGLGNAYPRCVNEEGNRRAQQLVAQVFSPCPGEWRGLGQIDGSAVEIRQEYRRLDARQRLDLPAFSSRQYAQAGCRCGDVVAGRIDPSECQLFGKTCRPERPWGACMVSSEGACQIAFAEVSAWPERALST